MDKINFEKYIKKQESLDEIPKIKPEYHFSLDDIAGKILRNESVNQEDLDNLEIVFEKTQSIEMELINSLDFDRAENKIDSIEFLYSTNFFLTSSQNGPDSTSIRNAFIRKDIDLEKFSELIGGIQIPVNTRELLNVIYNKTTQK